MSASGKKYAKGSHKQWSEDGWETRHCWKCGERIVLARGHAIHCFNQGRPFSLCEKAGCAGSYAEARAALGAAA